MLEKKVEGEEKIFAELRKSLWELCFFSEKKRVLKKASKINPYSDCEKQKCDGSKGAVNKQEE